MNTQVRTPERVAIVTGGARGIGASVVHTLSAAGYAVGVVDLDLAEAQNVADIVVENGGKAVAVRADVSSSADAQDAVATIADSLGAPTVLVNNAGITRDNLLFKMSLDDWDTVMSVHLRGAFLFSAAVQRHMVETGWGRIVNMSSVSALGNRGQSNYAAAKAGLQGLTKTMAIELGKFGITVNAVAPGFIETDMNRAVAERLGLDFEDYKAQRVQNIPVGRVGQAADIAAAVAYFVSEDAGFVSGQVLYVAGGPRG